MPSPHCNHSASSTNPLCPCCQRLQQIQHQLEETQHALESLQQERTERQAEEYDLDEMQRTLQLLQQERTSRQVAESRRRTALLRRLMELTEEWRAIAVQQQEEGERELEGIRRALREEEIRGGMMSGSGSGMRERRDSMVFEQSQSVWVGVAAGDGCVQDDGGMMGNREMEEDVLDDGEEEEESDDDEYDDENIVEWMEMATTLEGLDELERRGLLAPDEDEDDDYDDEGEDEDEDEQEISRAIENMYLQSNWEMR